MPAPQCLAKLSAAASLIQSATVTLPCGPVPVAGLACEAWRDGAVITRGEAVPVFQEAGLLGDDLKLKGNFRVLPHAPSTRSKRLRDQQSE